MKSTYLGVFAFLLSLSYLTPGLGQGRWAISANLSPAYAFADYKRVLPVSNASLPGPPSTELRSQSHTWGYSFGLMGHYQLSASWSASAGVWAAQVVTSKGDFTTNGHTAAITYSNKHPFNYAYQVPVMVNYESANKRLSPYLSAGVRPTSEALVIIA